jgi:hypothetical protein
MKNEEHQRFKSRMNEVQPSDKAAILVTMDCGGDIRINTFGEPAEVGDLRKRIKEFFRKEDGIVKS